MQIYRLLKTEINVDVNCIFRNLRDTWQFRLKSTEKLNYTQCDLMIGVVRLVGDATIYVYMEAYRFYDM